MQQMDAAEIPAAERAIVGLCHSLNDQLAAVSAYTFLLKRRGALGELEEPLQAHLDKLAETIRLVRSLARNPEQEPGPVAVSLLAETATALMHSYPDGPVAFELAESASPAVVRCDWSSALRALLFAGAWVSRDYPDRINVRLSASTEIGLGTLTVEAIGDLPVPIDSGSRFETGERFNWVTTGDRSRTLHHLP